AGELPHPYYNLNSSQYSWVDEKVWYYRKEFQVHTERPKGYAYLYFHGIDYFARIWLNGQLLGEHQGMFGGPAIEVSRLLRTDAANELVVEVRAGNWGNKANYKPRAPGRIIKPWVIAGGTGGEMFFPLGMWQGVRLEFTGATHLDRPFLTTKSASDKEATLHLSVELLRDKHSLDQEFHPTGEVQIRYYRPWWELEGQRKQLRVRLELTEKGATRPAFSTVLPIDTLPGRNWLEADISVPSPKLWWPNRLGPQNLYRATLTLLDEGQELDRLEFSYGIRTLQAQFTSGPRLTDRWSEWQFVANGRKFFVKGVNWMPADILLDLPKENYHWLLSAAKNAGVQMVRIWGGGILEPEAFYEVANELGILVWQDFPIGNMLTPDYPQPVWEAQVMQTIFRLRNHPALAVYCGGNEFNPYAEGNAASIGILERSLQDFDNTRPFRRTSPDNGSMHDYPDMDPTWYARKFPFLPFMAETGMHNIPNPETMREVVSAAELNRPLDRMYDPDFETRFPDFRHHFVEYQASRVPRMLSRASHIDNMRSPSIEAIAEATQIGAGEFYQVMSEALQSNYPITAGLLPWVFKRPWPVVAIQLMDGFGHPTAPYYFLRRTYQETHVQVLLPHLLLAPGESLPIHAAVTHQAATGQDGLKLHVRVLDDRFASIWEKNLTFSLGSGPTVLKHALGDFAIPSTYRDRYLFLVAELSHGSTMVSRQVYHPRVLAKLADPKALSEFRQAPKEWPEFPDGPWLKPSVARNSTSLRITAVRREAAPSEGRSLIYATITNDGRQPAYPVKIDLVGGKRSFFATDNYFWLAPGESKELKLEVKWRDTPDSAKWRLTASAWNAAEAGAPIPR
ncbi:MAG: hypothetical protein MUF01_18760, partial [Bryobacterales bacterium]|nr:hypothetical protein [Bryobacterales bacterium]